MTRLKHALIVAFAPLPEVWKAIRMFRVTIGLAVRNLFGKDGARRLEFLYLLNREVQALKRMTPEQRDAYMEAQRQNVEALMRRATTPGGVN